MSAIGHAIDWLTRTPRRTLLTFVVLLGVWWWLGWLWGDVPSARTTIVDTAAEG